MAGTQILSIRSFIASFDVVTYKESEFRYSDVLVLNSLFFFLIQLFFKCVLIPHHCHSIEGQGQGTESISSEGQYSNLLDKPNYIFNMMGVRKHIYRLHCLDKILGIKQCQITSLCGRIAAYIDNYLGLGIEYDVNTSFISPA